MPDTTDLFEIIRTTRAMRRLKPDPVPDALIRKIIDAGVCAPNGGNSQRWRFLVVKDRAIKKQVQVWYKKAFDEVVGPRYLKSSPPPGVTKEAYVRQHAAVEYLTDHFHDALVRRVDLPGGAEHATGRARAGARRDAHHASPPVREGERGGAGLAAGRAFVRDPADRLSDGKVRARRPWCAEGSRVRG
jgi:nitroreductase